MECNEMIWYDMGKPTALPKHSRGIPAGNQRHKQPIPKQKILEPESYQENKNLQKKW